MVWLFIILSLAVTVNGHGRLIDPPSRSSAWRFGYPTPVNYNDIGLYCGGVGVQYGRNGGKCGVCGDAYDANPRENEAGGKYATGLIVKKYKTGSVISAVVDITTNHQGYFEFSVCPNNNPKRAAKENCFQSLQIVGHGSKMMIGRKSGKIEANVRLPRALTCSQCVFRWIYTAGNSWGTDPNGRSCLGCGNQEQFYGCADIAISSSGTFGGTKTDIFTTKPKQSVKTTRAPITVDSNCLARHPYKTKAMDQWCKQMCSKNVCPKSHCHC